MVQMGDEEIGEEISKLEEKYHQQVYFDVLRNFKCIFNLLCKEIFCN